MDVQAVGHAGHAHEVLAKAAAPQQQPPASPAQGSAKSDSVELSDKAKALAADSESSE